MTRRRIGALVLFGVLFLLPALIFSPYRLGVLTLVAAYAIASLGQNLVTGYAALPSLGNGAFFAVGAYVAGALMTASHFRAPVALLLSVLAAGLVGAIVGLLAFRVSDVHISIFTFVLVFAVNELMMQWSVANSVRGGRVTADSPSWLLDSRGLYLAAIIATAIVYTAVWCALRTRFATALDANELDPLAAAGSETGLRRYQLIACVSSGLLTGLAGAVYLYYARSVTPSSFPLALSLAFLAMIVIGGRRSLAGSIIGAVIIGLLPQLLARLPPHLGGISTQSATPLVYSILVLFALRFLPEGIWIAATARLSDRLD